MKKIIGFVIIMICLSSLFSCEEAGDPKFTMKADVIELSEKILVDVTEAEYAEGEFLIIISDRTEIYDARGKKVSRDEISVGDKLIITYNGQVMMSYPPQVVALKIRVI